MKWFLLLSLIVSTAGCAAPWFDPADAKFEEGGFESTAVVKVERPGAPALAEAGAGVMKKGDRMVVGFWNIQWLDSPKHRGDKEAQKAEDLADFIAASRVDVLGVSEIGAVIAEGAWRSQTLEAVVRQLTDRKAGTWRYVLFPNSSDDLAQLTGVLWNGDRVQMLGWAAAPIDRKNADEIWHRHPVGVKFSAGVGLTDVVVIPIHMRCCLEVEWRRLEAERLVAALAAVTSALRDQDVMIIGDANMWKHDEPAGKVYRKAGLRDLNEADRPTHTAKVPFDRVFVADQPELRDLRMEVFATEYAKGRGWSAGEFKKKLSDHFLIRVAVPVGEDDD